MEPIPETARAIADFGPFVVEDEDLLAELLEQAGRVRDLAPSCVGVSLASNEDEVTFTVVATAKEVALLDAVQYVAGGPCVDAVEAEQVVAFEQQDLFDEHEWHLFARASATASVASTLTLPILDAAARVVGSVNLYASTPNAFDGHHEAIATIFDAWAPGAVTNADLSFTTRDVAAHAPQQLRADVNMAIACNVLAAESDVGLDVARRRLTEAALRAGVTEAQLAQIIVDLRGDGGH